MSEKQKDGPNINKNIHPRLAALFYIAIAYVLEYYAHPPLMVPAGLRNTGFALTFIGALLGMGALIELRKARTTLDPHGSVKSLVMNGVYRFTRNPIYLGFLLMVIRLPLNSGLYSGILIAPFFAVTLNRLVIEKEKAYLEKKFEEQYTGNRSKVRRWL